MKNRKWEQRIFHPRIIRLVTFNQFIDMILTLLFDRSLSSEDTHSYISFACKYSYLLTDVWSLVYSRWPSTCDLTFDLTFELTSDTTSYLASDFWPLTSRLLPSPYGRRPATSDLTSNSTSDPGFDPTSGLIFGLRPRTSYLTDLQLLAKLMTLPRSSHLWTFTYFIQPTICDLRPVISDQLWLNLELALKPTPSGPVFSQKKNLILLLSFVSIMSGIGKRSRDEYTFKKL